MTGQDTLLKTKKVAEISRQMGDLGAAEGDLDDLVLDAACEVATEVNNAGVAAQLSYLLSSGWTHADILFRVNIALEGRLAAPQE